MKEKKVKRFLAIALVTFIVTLSYMTSGATMQHKLQEKPVFTEQTITVTDTTVVNDNETRTDSLKIMLIDEVDKYIRNSYNIYDKKLSEYLVCHSLTYDIELCFMMAQTQLETGFGTMGAGRPTSRHSLFGVNGKWKDYNSAIEDYCKLLRKSYLGNKKSVHDLMRNYVTLGGARYAANRRYEQELSSAYSKIKKNTNIHNLWIELNKPA